MADRGGKCKVRLIAKSTSVSAVPVKPGKTFPLSVLDHAMAKHTLHLVFYYPRGAMFSMSREQIKESFSDVLTNYPPMTGRLVRGSESGNWVVRCNDAGVRVYDAEVDVSMDDWFQTADEEDEKDLACWEEMGQDPFIWSPFYIQITEFKDGGIAVGLSCPHMYADPTCATLLIKAWGDAHRRACIVHPPFLHPPALDIRPTVTSASITGHLESKSKHIINMFPASKFSTTTFRFDEHAVLGCLDEIKTESPDATPFDAIVGLFWWRIGNVSSLNVGVDFRKTLYAPLPHGYFGNAIHFSEVSGGMEVKSITWGKLAEAVRAHVAGLGEDDHLSAVEWLDGRRRKDNGSYGEAFQMYGPGLTFAKLDHLFSYESIFDENGPTHASYRVGGQLDGEGMVLVLPHPEGGEGRTVIVTLPKDKMDEIHQDDVIQRIDPKLVFQRSNR